MSTTKNNRFMNQEEHPGKMRIGNPRQNQIILMKQLEEIEKVNRAILHVLLEMVPEEKKKSLIFQMKDLLDDGKLNNSVE